MTYAEAERYLLSLELFGMRFGLDRMRRLMTALGSPQERYGRIDDADLSEARFAAAVTRAARAADKVNRTLEEGDSVTQFEALTAAAYSELAAAGVDVAGLDGGGRRRRPARGRDGARRAGLRGARGDVGRRAAAHRARAARAGRPPAAQLRRGA